jgi:hypothetical protein
MNSDCIPPITITIIIVWASAARRNEGSCHPENVPQGRNLDLPTTRKTEKVGEKNPRMYARTSPFFGPKPSGSLLSSRQLRRGPTRQLDVLQTKYV